jgi:hypothetical protein
MLNVKKKDESMNDDLKLSPAQEAELALAEAEYEADPDAGIPMEVVFARLRRKILRKYFSQNENMKEAI